MKLKNLIDRVPLLEVQGSVDAYITGVSIDSRRVAEGHLFVAVRGTQADGHRFIPKAIEQGAKAVVCEEMPEECAEGVTYLKVECSEQVVGQLASNFYGRPSEELRLVGVTGTNGKTTIATVLYNMMRRMGHRVGLLSTVCNYIDDEAVPTDHTTPDPVTLNALLRRMVDAGCDLCFMEVSSHSVVQNRIGGLMFTGGIFTN
ncbi:MAG: UDP-N-acetylmuramoyl-L-alanyl-D-glutamate--2,6-diaminopimelate ligase, partial [Bacteroidaceae bacterium]|nr:UDP-N-acetylmuramoyl-L-alanyl-D-glutamate--2,6-diaminopimelate ligase [Bacteroidaceae bacterium]